MSSFPHSISFPPGLAHDFRFLTWAPATSASLLPGFTQTLDHNKLWEILQEMGIPDHLTCLLRNLYEGQAATVTTEHGTDWFIHMGGEVFLLFVFSHNSLRSMLLTVITSERSLLATQNTTSLSVTLFPCFSSVQFSRSVTSDSATP